MTQLHDTPVPVRNPILSVEHLSTVFATSGLELVRAVEDVSFDLYPGEALGIVGESGSGKTVSAMSILGLLPEDKSRITNGRLIFDGRDLRACSRQEIRRIRGEEIAMVFQDPMTSLNPVLTIGSQISEALMTKNRGMSSKAARQRSIELLQMVGVSNPALRYTEYPHQFSGGMRQRAMIAMAIANNPRILIADEPTTALDVTIQAQVLEVLKTAQDLTDAATILITHDLGVVAEVADRVVVMYSGRVVEQGTVEEVFRNPAHPYTVGLMSSIPRIDGKARRLVPISGEPPSPIERPTGCAFHPRCALGSNRAVCREVEPPLEEVGSGHTAACHFSLEVPSLRRLTVVESVDTAPDHAEPATDAGMAADEVLKVEGLATYFPIRSRLLNRTVGWIKAVDGVDLNLKAGETLGVVGESGCGKSTLGKTIIRLLEPTAGRISFKGADITDYSRRRLRPVRRHLQMVFQDPYSSLDPKKKVTDLVGEPLRIHNDPRADDMAQAVGDVLETVGLRAADRHRYAHEFSGGQRQRIGIARAIVTEPDVLVLDEPVSALDVSIQAQIVNLLMDLQDERGMSYIFIAHDLSVVRQIAHRVAVMYLGRVVELSETHTVFDTPLHPYTKALLSAVPVPDPGGRRKRIVLGGDVPNPGDPPPGCHFHPRCFMAEDRCSEVDPALEEVADAQRCACLLVEGHRQSEHVSIAPNP